ESEPRRGSVGSFTDQIAVFVETRRYRVSVLTRPDKLKQIGHFRTFNFAADVPQRFPESSADLDDGGRRSHDVDAEWSYAWVGALATHRLVGVENWMNRCQSPVPHGQQRRL